MSTSSMRCLAVGLGATALAGVLEQWLVPVAGGGPDRSAFDDVLVQLSAAVAALGVAWLWLATCATLLEVVLDGARRSPGVPDVVRRWVLAACGAGLAAGLATPGLATPASATPGEVHTDRGPVSAIAGLPLPDRAAGLPGRAAIGTGPPSERRVAGEVIVRPGDTLWAIAAHHLGDPRRWPEIYALNDAAIGADPDLIHPATRLRLPADRPEETP